MRAKRFERRAGIWNEIKSKWLDDYDNQRIADAESCKRSVTFNDEWLAEAYLQPDYKFITKAVHDLDIKQYVIQKFMLQTNMLTGDDDEEA